MTKPIGTCNLYSAPHPKEPWCEGWKPITVVEPKPPRVEIWRASKRVITIACSDGSAWNEVDDLRGFAGAQHEGVWSSRHLAFMPKPRDCFSDGTPVSLYEGLEPLAERRKEAR